MAVKVELSRGNGRLGDIVDFSVSEDATPLLIGDTSGSVGQISVTARSINTGPVHLRSGAVVGDEVVLTDDTTIEHTTVKGLGEIRGQITQGSMPGERISTTAETILSRFNTDRTAKPFYGAYQSPTTAVTYRTNYATNPSREVDLTGVVLNLAGGAGAATLSRPTTDGLFGNAFARVTWTTGDAIADGGMYDIITGIQGGTSYTFSTYARVTRVAAGTLPGQLVQRLRGIMRFYNSADVAITGDTNVYFDARQGEWVRISGAATAPIGATYARFYVVSATGIGFATWKAGDTLDTDGVLVERNGLNTYFDASFPSETVTDYPNNLSTRYQYQWSGTPHASQSVVTVTATQITGSGYDATQGEYFRYLCGLVGISAIAVEGPFDDIAVAYPGWTGNVWKYLKDFCAAVRGEIALVDDVVILRQPRTRTIPVESIKGPALSVDSTLSAQFVQVYNYNSRWGNSEVAYSPETVYQVEAGTVSISEVTIPHFIDSVNTPVAVDNFSPAYTTGEGQYSVVDSQGLRVDARWWRENGGKVEVEIIDPNTLRITITGARLSPEAYMGPFRLGRDAGDIIPALDITGTGVFLDKQPVRIRTGVSAEQTSVVEGSIIDNIFLSNADLAYTRGLDAAANAAGPVVKFSGVLGYDILVSGQAFGIVAGSRIQYADNIFRITSATYTSAGLAFEATADMVFSDAVDLYSFTFSEFNVTYGGFTFAMFNAANSGNTFESFNTAFGSPTFELFNSIYANASFSDHATYPYIAEAFDENTSTL